MFDYRCSKPGIPEGYWKSVSKAKASLCFSIKFETANNVFPRYPGVFFGRWGVQLHLQICTLGELTQGVFKSLSCRQKSCKGVTRLCGLPPLCTVVVPVVVVATHW